MCSDCRLCSLKSLHSCMKDEPSRSIFIRECIPWLTGDHTRSIMVSTPSLAAGGIMKFAKVRYSCLGCKATLAPGDTTLCKHCSSKVTALNIHCAALCCRVALQQASASQLERQCIFMANKYPGTYQLHYRLRRDVSDAAALPRLQVGSWLLSHCRTSRCPYPAAYPCCTEMSTESWSESWNKLAGC